MEIYDINKLIKYNDDILYDITQMTFQYDPENVVTFAEYTVKRGEEMRIDTVCRSIYKNTDYVDILCSVNNIDNPLNIKEGEVLIYPVMSDIKHLRYSDSDAREDVASVINSDKNTKIDPNRKEFNDNKQSIPPTLLPKRTDPINIKGTSFNIGEGLF